MASYHSSSFVVTPELEAQDSPVDVANKGWSISISPFIDILFSVDKGKYLIISDLKYCVQICFYSLNFFDVSYLLQMIDLICLHNRI